MIIAFLQARYSSSRLPGKVMKPLLNEPMLIRQLERLSICRTLDKLVVLTSIDSSDNVIEEECSKRGITFFRGNLNDVLDRFYQGAVVYNPNHIVRLTGDCPLIDPEVVDNIVKFHILNGFDYTSNTLEPTFPDGLDVEVFKRELLIEAWKKATLPSQREHVTPYMYLNEDNKYTLGSYINNIDLSHLRWTVDTLDDFMFVESIYSNLYAQNPSFSTENIINFISKNNELATINQSYIRNEGYLKSLQADKKR
ncbi:cytidylyltransferase domain-containing protein [Paenibacillus thalictri]|uniref:Spore coat protein n=1 Tax=Paenibacillus thalictri TaxID=2527873 RepID=A0A4Q9DET2_9BACL|nr:glycosyltransferase family protein [Paenibacillus thalictri]TBL67778.1 spore coat protein [Paenibacillus thalictri]